jgi:hypothetical protein
MRPGFPWTNARVHLPSCVTPSLAFPQRVGSPPKGQPLSNHRSARTRARWYRNINRLCIDYASRPRLSSRLTLGGLAFPRNPWASGGGGSHSSLATHASIRTRPRSTPAPADASPQDRRSPTTRPEGRIRGFGSGLEPRYIIRARPLDQ